MADDIVDVLTKDRKPTGRKAVRYTDLGHGNHRQVIHICIFDADNMMLIQKRTPTKRSFPGYWDVSVGGGVDSGETPQQAAGRELKEELGLDFQFDSAPAVSLDSEETFDDFFVIHMDLDPDSLELQKDEVSEVRWASFDDISAMIGRKEFIPYNRGLLRYLFHVGKEGTIEYGDPQ